LDKLKAGSERFLSGEQQIGGEFKILAALPALGTLPQGTCGLRIDTGGDPLAQRYGAIRGIIPPQGRELAG
jgi:hypothetical protein